MNLHFGFEMFCNHDAGRTCSARTMIAEHLDCHIVLVAKFIINASGIENVMK